MLTTNSKKTALKYFLKNALIEKFFFDGSSLYIESEDDIIKHDNDGYFKIYKNVIVCK